MGERQQCIGRFGIAVAVAFAIMSVGVVTGSRQAICRFELSAAEEKAFDVCKPRIARTECIGTPYSAVECLQYMKGEYACEPDAGTRARWLQRYGCPPAGSISPGVGPSTPASH